MSGRLPFSPRQRRYLLRRILSTSPTITSFCLRHTLHYHQTVALVQGYLSPFKQSGKYRLIARQIAEALEEPVESLFTPPGLVQNWNTNEDNEPRSLDPGPYDFTVQKELRARVRALLTTLTPREEKVLRLRFGIGEQSDHTLEEVGQDFEVTREHVRQIEAKALRKLRHPSRRTRLVAFIRD